MAGSLKGRLARLKSLEKRGDIEKAAALPALRKRERKTADQQPCAEPHFLNGWRKIADCVYCRELIVADPLPMAVDPVPFMPRCSPRRSAAAGSMHASASTGRGSLLLSDSLVFFDFETTGLSGGAGTLAFLAAVGRQCARGFSIRQYFLSDYPGEHEYIEAIINEIEGCGGLVSYNGRCFDYPLLKTRCALNGLRAPDVLQLDLLFPARRLWRKKLGGASLGTIESRVLGIDRGPDVDGALIPALYFDYLRTGAEGDMALVMSHNASDVGTLASLMGYLCSIYADPLCGDDAALDRTALGFSLLSIGRDSEGETLLEMEAARGSSQAFCGLSMRYRYCGRLDDFERIWHSRPDSWEACIEGAKFFEHQKRDLRAALNAVDDAAALDPSDWQKEELEKRRLRLMQKIARSEAC